MKSSKIEWCDSTINAVCGCTFGCPFCYARKMNQRFGWVEDFSRPQFFPDRLKALKSTTPKVIFMDSMSDVADWKDEWIKQVFSHIVANPQHIYLFLSKRLMPFLDRLFRLEALPVENSKKVWFGVSVTTQAQMDETDEFFVTPDFMSIEPLLEPVKLSRHPLWVIIGAETGNRKDKVIPKKEWVDDIVRECDRCETPVFMKESLLPIMGEENMRREFPRDFRHG